MDIEHKNAIRSLLACHTIADIKNIPGLSCNQNLSVLMESIEKHQKLEIAHAKAQDVCKTISRKIGVAKKQGLSADHLISEMREKSEAIKLLSGKIQNLENELANIMFPPQEITTRAKTTKESIAGRQYHDTEVPPNITISILEKNTATWNEYVKNNMAASVYHLAEWRDVIHSSFGHENYYLFANDSLGKCKGILPLIRLKSRLFGDFMVSLPYFNYGGAVADHPKIEQQLIEHANDLAEKLGVNHIEYRDDIKNENLPVKSDKVNMILSLPHDQDELWNSFTPKLRAQIKRPQRENPSVLNGGIEYLDEFYDVFAQNMRDLGTPVYAKSFFRNIIEILPDNVRIMIVRLDGNAVGAAFLVGFRDTLEIPWASTLRRVGHLSINMLMYWEILCYAVENHYTRFDFGRSSVNSGTYRFKKQWGAEPKQLYWHYWLKSGNLPQLNPSNPKYHIMINVWKKLPVFITKILGPGIVKNLP